MSSWNMVGLSGTFIRFKSSLTIFLTLCHQIRVILFRRELIITPSVNIYIYICDKFDLTDSKMFNVNLFFFMFSVYFGSVSI